MNPHLWLAGFLSLVSVWYCRRGLLRYRRRNNTLLSGDQPEQPTEDLTARVARLERGPDCF